MVEFLSKGDECLGKKCTDGEVAVGRKVVGQWTRKDLGSYWLVRRLKILSFMAAVIRE